MKPRGGRGRLQRIRADGSTLIPRCANSLALSTSCRPSVTLQAYGGTSSTRA